MKAQAKNKPAFIESKVTVRIAADRKDWFSVVSDQIGLTHDQAVSALLEADMRSERDDDDDSVRMFVAEAAADLYPERKSIRALSKAYRSADAAEYAINRAKGAALVELSDMAPKQMGLIALNRTKDELTRQRCSQILKEQRKAVAP